MSPAFGRINHYRDLGLTLILGLVSSVAWSQPQQPAPLPPAWQAMGILQWPPPSAEITLEFDEIVLPGQVEIRVRSSVRFTQTLVLFRRARNEPGNIEELAIFNLGPQTASTLVAKIAVTETQTFVALAKTRTGWYRTERQIKVGRPPK